MPIAAEPEQLHTPSEVAQILRVSRATVYRLIADGALEPTDVRRPGAKRSKLRLSDSSVARYQAQARLPALPQGRGLRRAA